MGSFGFKVGKVESLLLKQFRRKVPNLLMPDAPGLSRDPRSLDKASDARFKALNPENQTHNRSPNTKHALKRP